MSVIVIADITVGRCTSTTLATVKVARSIRNSTKQHLMRIIPAASAAISAARSAATHVVDHGVHENPK